MNIAIYQVNMDRGNDNVAFMNYEKLERFQGSAAINGKIYDKVFEGEVSCGNLEEVYQMFNINHPDGYRGRSLSVSDIVEVVSEGKSTFYFCDSIGFKEIDFDPDLTETLKEKKIKVVLCEPEKLAKAASIEASLESYQKIVGGYIEAYYPFEEPVCIVCNEEGKINSLPLNRAVYADPDRGEMLDIIAGTFFVCDCSGENFGSLSPEQLRRYTELFKYPERFFRMDGEIRAAPYLPEKAQER